MIAWVVLHYYYFPHCRGKVFGKIWYGVSRWGSILFWDTSKLCLTRLLLYISAKATIVEVHWGHFGMVESKPRYVYRFVTNCKFSKDMNPPNEAYLEAMQTIPFYNVIRSLKYATICIKLDIVQVVEIVKFIVNHGQPC